MTLRLCAAVVLVWCLTAPTASADVTYTSCIRDGTEVGATCATTLPSFTIEHPWNIAISPDGASLYTSGNPVAVFARAAATGSLSYASSPAGASTFPSGVAVSPDGHNLYLVDYAADAIVTFDRAGDGSLSNRRCISDPIAYDPAYTPMTCPTSTTGLFGASNVVVAPNGRNVYVTSARAGAVVSFSRDPGTGNLTPIGCVKETGSTASTCSTTARGIGAADGIAVSSDGASVYVTSARLNLAPPTIALLAHDSATGALAERACYGLDTCIPMAQAPLEGATGIAVSPDGTNLYVEAFNGSMTVLTRSTLTGAVLFAGCLVGPAYASAWPACASSAAIAGASSGYGGHVVVSPDARNVYAADWSLTNPTLNVFARDPASGLLSGVSCVKAPASALPCTATAQGLSSISDLVISPDGAQLYVTGYQQGSASTYGGTLATFSRVADTAPRVMAAGVAAATTTARYGSARLPLSCAVGVTGYCSGDVAVAALGNSTGRGRARRRFVVVARVAGRVRGSNRIVVRITLPARWRRQLAARHSLTLLVRFRRIDPNGRLVTAIRRVTFRIA